VTFQES
jgi:hypothetical protein